MGPFGSGKSTTAAMDILYYGLAQPPSPIDNIRYSRWGVIRASYPNLTATTRKTIMECMPDGAGYVTMGNAPLHGCYKFGPLPDGTHCQIELEFWSAMTEEDAKKFRSANWTGAWINEATEVSYEVFANCMVRSGRFPAAYMGKCAWRGVIMDFNRPPKGHWLWGLFDRESMSRDGFEYPIASFSQPPAAFFREDEYGHESFEINPEAENLENLTGGADYYRYLITLLMEAGKVEEVKSLYCLLETESRVGRPVWPMFNVKRHVALQKINPVEGAPLIIGCDPSGIHPAAVLAQYQQGRWCVLDELSGDQEGLDVFMNSGLIPLVMGRYPRSEVTVSCDPANARDAYTGLAPTTHLQRAGFIIAPRTTNRPDTRIAAVSALLNIDIGGLLISPHCENLIAAMKGGDGANGYHFTKHRLRGSVEIAYSEVPEKNAASHLADALQYLALHINRESQDNIPEAFILHQKIKRRNADLSQLMRR
jgi:hypothetical protein